MIYLFHGTDRAGVHRKMRQVIDGLLKKKPDASLVFFSEADVSEDKLEAVLGGQGLFQSRYIVHFDGVLTAQTRDAVCAYLSKFAQSEHVYIFSEGVLPKSALTKFEKCAEKVQEFSLHQQKKETFNIFVLTDAFGRRRKKDLWVLYQQAKAHQLSDEEIHGVLFWQLKTMLYASTGIAKETGLKPFVHSKALGYLRNYSTEELRQISAALIRLPHDSRRGIHEFSPALERFILSI